MRAANYVEETTTSIAGTSGDGAVTLSQITSKPRFSTVLGTQNTTVRYVIEDTVNFKFETGIGHVSSNVLTRTQVRVTWDGTTYTDNGATALQFGASPTSGNIKIRMSPTAETIFPELPAIQTVVSSGGSWDIYRLSDHYYSTSNSGTGAALTADREYYSCYRLSGGGVLSGAQFEVTATAAASLKWALYSCASTGLPGAKIVDFVTTSTSSTGIKTDTATASWTPAGKVRLVPGWYYIGHISAGTASLRGVTASTSFASSLTPIGRPNSYGYGSRIYVAGNYTTGLPATPNLSGGSVDSVTGAGSNTWWGLKVDVT